MEALSRMAVLPHATKSLQAVRPMTLPSLPKRGDKKLCLMWSLLQHGILFSRPPQKCVAESNTTLGTVLGHSV